MPSMSSTGSPGVARTTMKMVRVVTTSTTGIWTIRRAR